MSVNYYPTATVSFDELFDGRLVQHGISELKTKDSTETSRALTDGTNVLWIYRDLEGGASATRFGGADNDPTSILVALEKVFRVEWENEDDADQESDDGDDEEQPRH